MTVLSAPLWVQLVLMGEAAALAWLVWRFGWPGFAWGCGVAVVFWFLLGLLASYLLSRLEGGRAALLPDILHGALTGAARLSLVAAPLMMFGAGAGGALRRIAPPKQASP